MKLFIIIFIYIRLFFINKRLKNLDSKNKIIDNLLKNISDKNDEISPKVIIKIVTMSIAIYNNKMRYIEEQRILKTSLVKLGVE